MKAWYDACTGKHVRYAIAVARRLRTLGHEVILTTRQHPDTLALAELLEEDFLIVGRYSPDSALSRLKGSLERQLAFCERFGDKPPHLAISHGSVDLIRVAFGLRIPSISTADAPHAIAANRLGLPLVDILLASKAIPLEEYERFGVKRIERFAGVDEVAWVKNYPLKPKNYKRPLIVVRQMETKASYAEKKQDITERIAMKLSNHGNVMFIPRYDKRPRKKLIIPHKLIDSVNLSAAADLVISVGGTISREAALQGTPSIVVQTFGQSYVNDYLSKLGFPLFTVQPSQIIKRAKQYLGQKWDTKKQLKQLENPVDYVEKLTQEIF
ncbi:MAG: DUF354 domain-containing protein [Candidatus Bathyarchaeota archaeon]|nr:MAG: DUF354 domain-containing protein [Candidatus Bathyarchaeota archaeon]